MNVKDLLTIKTGELIAKTEELREVNESLHLLNDEIRQKTEEIRNTKKDLSETERDLLVAYDKLTNINKKFTLTSQELANVNMELVVANEQIKEHLLNQKEFIDITAHELRTPIQAISGNFELIEMDIPSLLQNSLTGQNNINNEFEGLIKDKPRLEQFTNRLISTFRSSQRLEKLVNDILDTSRIESNRFELHKESFNLNEKIQNVIKDIYNKTSLSSHQGNSTVRSSIVFEPQDDPIIVFADKIRIFEVLSNLINNAIKFSNGKPITISVKRPQINGNKMNPVNDEDVEYGERDNSKKKDEFVLVYIQDKGKGIDEEVLPRLFNKFVTKSDQGTGLGLFIAKNIIEAHGGRIWAQNNKNEKGSTFTFCLPINK
ncbi:sensor histidine kinase [Candidatus Nitrosocosmicus arcticus]|uniref:histidine kinase n=1 Tax=Candidatus Nitrosocosmicus arcticus TaxID=2035267 RepID=A0A557SUX7_9ARCH|nr:HAMP domain-containing sensor histidine kinase [Candidatus Nitrosocosmicus arcticus]TVP40412.1 putative Histidine kinase [Candidatus Nitrosocosmicus arcticus]